MFSGFTEVPYQACYIKLELEWGTLVLEGQILAERGACLSQIQLIQLVRKWIMISGRIEKNTNCVELHPQSPHSSHKLPTTSAKRMATV